MVDVYESLSIQPFIILDRINEKPVCSLESTLVEPLEIEDIATSEKTIKIEYPLNARDAGEIQQGRKLITKNIDGNWQMYEIVNTRHIIGDILEAYCESEHYEMGTDPLNSHGWLNATAADAIADVLTGTRWNVGTIEVSGAYTTYYKDLNPLAALQTVRQTWGGILNYRVAIENSQITRYVDLLERKGTFTGQRFELGHNLESIEVEIDTSELVTALYGRGLSDEIDLTTNEPVPLDFSGAEWTTPTNPANKPLGQKYVEDVEATAAYGKPDGLGGRRPIFGTYDSEAQTPETLLGATWTVLQRRNKPRVTITAKAIDLEKVSGFEHEKARLGDTVYCIVKKGEIVIRLALDIIRIERNQKDPTQTKIIFGEEAPVGTNTIEALKERTVAIDKIRRRLDRGRGQATITIASEDTSRMPWYADIIIPAGEPCHTQIQEAINKVPSNGGKVVLLDGEYNLANGVNLYRGALEGQGPGTILYTLYSGFTGITLYDKTKLMNLMLNGKGVGGTAVAFTNGLSAGIVVSDIIIDDFDWGIQCGSYNEGCFIRNNIIRNIRTGDGILLHARSFNNSIENNLLEDIEQYGITLYTSIPGEILSKNSVINNKCYRNRIGIWIGSGYMSTIVANNICNENRHYGIALVNSGDATVTNNTCVSNGQDADSAYANIWILDSFRNDIQGNFCRMGEVISEGTLQGVVNPSTLVLAEGATDELGFFNGKAITLSGGHAGEQKRVIVGNEYNNPLFVVLDSPLDPYPSGLESYKIYSTQNLSGYGIRIQNSASSKNLVTNNDLLDSGRVANISDGGSGTVTVAGNRVV